MRRLCDLVMKGGVTSGVVYPAAIYEISREFDLKSIGGTSAGAIAAALAAAAQYRRLHAQATAGASDGEAGYQRLNDLPAFLGKDNNLFKLFAPNRGTKALFNIVVDLFAPKRSLTTKATSLLRAYPTHAVIGLIPAAAYGLLIADVNGPPMRAMHCLLAVFVGLSGAIAASAIGLVMDLVRELPRNDFGLVTGVDDGDAKNDLALSTWLTREIETVAGLVPGKVPLTFGLLWNPSIEPGPLSLDDPVPAQQRDINLQMISTSLSEGRPYQFPMRMNRFYFIPDELRRFFPGHVVDWMVAHARTDATTLPGLTAMPPISDLPIIVATRMSLSFPILLSAVPLHAVDYTDADPQEAQQFWFSDGGLTSNFPISMFDSPLPRWPTLAFNLGTFGPRTPSNGIIITQNVGQGRLIRFTKLSGVASFLTAIFNALQNWNDNMQSTVPGVRDRIVTIAMRPDEGGLNLEMNAQMIETLRARGVAAAKALISRFSEPSALQETDEKLSWEVHRWARFRVMMSCLASYLGRLADTFQSPQVGDVSYDQLLRSNTADTVPRKVYPLSGELSTRQKIATCIVDLSSIGSRLAAFPELFDSAPKPTPGLVVRPELDK